MESPDMWWRVEEQAFRSGTPLVGGIIVRFRSFWNNIATRWYVLPLIEQQNEVNRRLVQEVVQLREEVAANQAILTALDRDLQDALRIQTGLITALRDEVHRLRQHIPPQAQHQAEAPEL